MYACIDLGSNSFHLLIAHWHDGEHDIVERFSEKVQLGEGLAATGSISPAAMMRGLNCLATFKHALARYPIRHCWAVGTNALRAANNAALFLAEAKKLGFTIDVVSGYEEAALVYAGVLSALPVQDIPRLVIDIGGGSTELIVGHGPRRLQTHSMDIGCISWRDLWFQDMPSDLRKLEAQLDLATEAALRIFDKVSRNLMENPWQEVFASSGTAKMLSGVCRQCGLYDGSNGVSLATLLALKPDVIRTALEPDFVLPGLKNSRRELVLPGWAVLTGFMQALSVQELTFSPAALREGMLSYLVSAAVRREPPLHVLKAC
jgi:exopolyphosphatase / guanosine-5'-triphosphate,3'-diphosphate pyrophosphatase